jgi:hypothetical protein
MDQIPQPHGEVVADWYKANEPATIDILEALARALAGEITLDDLKEVNNG